MVTGVLCLALRSIRFLIDVINAVSSMPGLDEAFSVVTLLVTAFLLFFSFRFRGARMQKSGSDDGASTMPDESEDCRPGNTSSSTQISGRNYSVSSGSLAPADSTLGTSTRPTKAKSRMSSIIDGERLDFSRPTPRKGPARRVEGIGENTLGEDGL